MWAEQVKTDEDAQLLASFSGESKGVDLAPSIRPSAPSIKASAASLKSNARETVRDEGYIMDETIPEEAAGLAATLPSSALEAEAEDDKPAEHDAEYKKVEAAVLDAVRAESPLPITENDQTIEGVAHSQDRAAATPGPESYMPTVPTVDGMADETGSRDAAAFPSKADDVVPLTASPGNLGTAPISFPAGGDDVSLRREGSIAESRPGAHGPSISFGPEVDRPPSQQGSVDIDENQQKRKRTASQNLSKFAKRLSLGRRVSAALSSPPATSPPASSPPLSDSPRPDTPTRNSTDRPVSPSPVPSTEEGSATLRGLLKRKDTSKDDKDKPPSRRRTTLSFSRPKMPKPEGSQS
jgi:hypothetical protein